MAASSSAAHNHYESRIDADVIDPDDLDINDLDDPLDLPTSSSAPLNPSSRLTSAIPGEDRRATLNTLDESVWDTLSRDIRAVWKKMQAVLWPRYTWTKWPSADDIVNNNATGIEGGQGAVGTSLQGGLGEWDLWGPLLACLSLATLLSICAAPSQKEAVFAGVFAMVWVGEAVVTMQIRLLGGVISFFQSVSIIGYTLFPIVVCAFLSAFRVHAIIRVPVYSICFLWSLAAGVSILGGSGVIKNRVALAVFPMAIFYFGLVCLCLIS
ncbi:hypothetical protein BZA77DRAFT_301329 [Pyronema omphalodes]|nr:hypothetical protein BZA77DRAFT_301329 [Pyronema omphalodes]